MSKDFKIDWNWESPLDAKGRELRATWGSLTISYKNEVITQVYDSSTKSVREHIYAPFYPLAEWIMLNWWFLMYEPYTSSKFTHIEDYLIRHNISFAKEGYALPNLIIKPQGQTVSLKWGNIKNDTINGIRFINNGEATLLLDEVKDELLNFVGVVSERLKEHGINDTLLQEEWNAYKNISKDEEEFCKVAAFSGLDPYNIRMCY